MTITRTTNLTHKDINHCDFSFEITSELAPPYDDLSKIKNFPKPFNKSYGFEESDFLNVDDDKMLAVAKVSDLICGYVLVSKSWNGFAQIDDVAVDKKFRKSGLGRLLINDAIDWAREQQLVGVRLETQSVNVSACHFYKKMGFEFGGFDKYLYRAIPDVKDEVALYWCYLFNEQCPES
ncbi:MAG: hypothetical protein B0W54_01140 [Cellvibrio sp. 79]|nr:MAG: hypothetical protein B0W54_01140 [Cellvibrio sp. 79]